MSNHLAIATVTEGLRYIVQNALSEIDSGAGVTLLRPDLSGKDATTHVNIYLFQVTPNPSWRNVDLPTRRTDGSLVDRPTAALDLHYIISFYGDETEGEIEAQRLLGATVSALHARPVLTREVIREVIDGTTFELLKSSNLGDQIDVVRIVPTLLNLEELSKLWSVFFQTSYILSVAYQCSVVLIESDVSPQQSLPVRTSGIRAVPFGRATISEIIDDAGKNIPITADSTILIKGSGLNGEHVSVKIGDLDAVPDRVTDSEIRVDLADPGAINPDDLRAGVLPVQSIYSVAMDPNDPVASLRVGWTSNVFPFVLRPEIDSTSQFDDPDGIPQLEVALRPDVGPRQRAILLLNQLNPAPGESPLSYVIETPSRAGDAAASTVTFAIPDVEAATYLIRVQIDGAESPLETDMNGTYNAPQVTIA